MTGPRSARHGTRTHRIHLRATDREWAVIGQRIAASGRTAGRWLRELALDKAPPARRSAAHAETIRRLGALATRLDLVAKAERDAGRMDASRVLSRAVADVVATVVQLGTQDTAQDTADDRDDDARV